MHQAPHLSATEEAYEWLRASLRNNRGAPGRQSGSYGAQDATLVGSDAGPLVTGCGGTTDQQDYGSRCSWLLDLQGEGLHVVKDIGFVST